MKIIRDYVQSVRMLWPAALLLALLMAWGCESDKSTDDVGGYLEDNAYTSRDRDEPREKPLVITPSPQTATRVGQQVRFKATGGLGPYRWRVADAGNGNVAVDGPSESIYTVVRVAPNEVIVTDRRGHAAIGQVAATVTALTATAVPTTLENDGDKAVLTASGGTPPYQWTVLDVALGHLVGTDTGNSVVYMRDHNGDNVVRVRDANNAVVNVRIVQP